jgi:F0F1-type ATP synthase assembly protein I
MLDLSLVRSLLPLLGLALELVVLVAGGLLLGSWLDARLGTGPWLTLGLSFGGFAAGVTHLAIAGMRASREADGQSQDDDAG